MFEINVTTEGKNELGLLDKLQSYAEGYGIPVHVSEDDAAAMIMNSFKRKIHADLEMMEIKVTSHRN